MLLGDRRRRRRGSWPERHGAHRVMLLQVATGRPAASVGSRPGLGKTQRSTAPVLLPSHPEGSSKERDLGATTKEPTIAHCSGHCSREQRFAGRASRQLITQRSLVQIQPRNHTALGRSITSGGFVFCRRRERASWPTAWPRMARPEPLQVPPGCAWAAARGSRPRSRPRTSAGRGR